MDEMALGARALEWMDGFWDAEAGLLRHPSSASDGSNPYQRAGVHVVRETATYAMALLGRDAPGDRDRADAALGAVLASQYDAPGTVFHGTWRRSPAEPDPGEAPREWIDYDPNWREFIGTALCLALDQESALPRARVSGIEAALRRAIAGSLERAVAPTYTNIALMAAFLLDWAGRRFGEGAWREAGETLAAAVAADFHENGAFPEYGSPTYYGIDLYGLALWRARAPSPRLRAWGAEIEAALWRDLARFYHADLRNLCGPYTRAYGMDMTSYAAALGCWIAPLVEEGRAPLPPFGPAVAHAVDLCPLAFVARLGTRPPRDVVLQLRAFTGERNVSRVISTRPRRVATAWLSRDVMLGAEDTGGRWIHWQHHPATAQWRTPTGGVGWLRLVTHAPVDAVALPGRLAMRVHTGHRVFRDSEVAVWLEVHPDPGAPLDAADGASWQLPGLRVALEVTPRVDAHRAIASEPAAAGARRVGWVFEPGAAPPHLALTVEVTP